MRFQVSQGLLFSSGDLARPRFVVEREKMDEHFPSFDFYGRGNTVTSVQGNLSTSYGHSYYVKVNIGSRYPYELPTVSLPYDSLRSGCPHTYKNDNLCIMRSGQWSTTMSLAFVVAKTAIWLNKYDSWLRNGCRSWPGKGQRH